LCFGGNLAALARLSCREPEFQSFKPPEPHTAIGTLRTINTHMICCAAHVFARMGPLLDSEPADGSAKTCLGRRVRG